MIRGLLLSVLGAVLLMVGGLDVLRNVLIITALPFSVIILLMVLALFRELNHERLMMGLYIEWACYIRPTAFPEQNKPFRSYEDDPPRAGGAHAARHRAHAAAAAGRGRGGLR